MMKIIKVTYTARAEYVETNKANIGAVMNDLQQLNHPGINYNCCVGADDKTFTHTAFFMADEDQKVLLELPSFKYFSEQLKASIPEAAPKQELLAFVGSSRNIF
jgi:predicted transcriptional regulator YdeE